MLLLVFQLHCMLLLVQLVQIGLSLLLIQFNFEKLLVHCLFVFRNGLRFADEFQILLHQAVLLGLNLLELLKESIMLDLADLLRDNLVKFLHLLVELSVCSNQLLQGFVVLVPYLLCFAAQILLQKVQTRVFKCGRMNSRLFIHLILLLITHNVIANLSEVLIKFLELFDK